MRAEVFRRLLLFLAAALVLASLLFYSSRRPLPTVDTLPARLADEEFWNIVSDFSEPGGYFRSDNFLSNETGYQNVIPGLLKSLAPGGVYMGVGPEQNFTYIAALEPKIAFIIDIRRQNMLELMMYRAFFELSP